MKLFFSFTIAVLIGISFFAYGQAGEKKNDLNGKIFTIKLLKTSGKKPGWLWSTDEIIFMSGKLKPKVMSTNERFPATAYSVTVDSSSSQKTIAFRATNKNP